MAIRAVLFDLDNTVWRIESPPDDEEIAWLQAEAVSPILNALAPALSPVDFVREFWERHFDWTDFGSTEGLDDLRWQSGPAKVRATLTAACGRECSHADAERVWLALNSLPSNVYGVRLYDDALDTIRSLRRAGMQLGVVTARPFSAAVMEHGLASLGVDGLIQAVVTSGDLAVRKPHPMLFQTAAARLGVAPSDALMVGDSYEADIVPAANLGMTTVLKLNDTPPGPNWPQAHYVVRDLRELLAIDCLALPLYQHTPGPDPAAATP